jgi:hypothetical protein
MIERNCLTRCPTLHHYQFVTRRDVGIQTLKVENAWVKTEKGQRRGVTILMQKLHYSASDIELYLKNGLLPKIILETFRLYCRFVTVIRQQAHDSTTPWESGPAKAMLDFHSEELWGIREHALSRKFLFLENYVYFREAEAKDFFHEKLTTALWKRIEEVGPAAPSTPKAEDTDRGCAHCRCPKVHDAMGVAPTRRDCPLGKLSAAKARLAGKEFYIAFKADSTLDVVAKVKSLCDTHK